MGSRFGKRDRSNVPLGACMLSFGFILILSVLFSILLPPLLETMINGVRVTSKVLAGFEIVLIVMIGLLAITLYIQRFPRLLYGHGRFGKNTFANTFLKTVRTLGILGVLVLIFALLAGLVSVLLYRLQRSGTELTEIYTNIKLVISILAVFTSPILLHVFVVQIVSGQSFLKRLTRGLLPPIKTYALLLALCTGFYGVRLGMPYLANAIPQADLGALLSILLLSAFASVLLPCAFLLTERTPDFPTSPGGGGQKFDKTHRAFEAMSRTGHPERTRKTPLNHSFPPAVDALEAAGDAVFAKLSFACKRPAFMKAFSLCLVLLLLLPVFAYPAEILAEEIRDRPRKVDFTLPEENMELPEVLPPPDAEAKLPEEYYEDL